MSAHAAGSCRLSLRLRFRHGAQSGFLDGLANELPLQDHRDISGPVSAMVAMARRRLLAAMLAVTVRLSSRHPQDDARHTVRDGHPGQRGRIEDQGAPSNCGRSD